MCECVNVLSGNSNEMWMLNYPSELTLAHDSGSWISEWDTHIHSRTRSRTQYFIQWLPTEPRTGTHIVIYI